MKIREQRIANCAAFLFNLIKKATFILKTTHSLSKSSKFSIFRQESPHQKQSPVATSSRVLFYNAEKKYLVLFTANGAGIPLVGTKDLNIVSRVGKLYEKGKIKGT